MKTSNKILLGALILVSLVILTGLLITKSKLTSALTQGDGNIVELTRDIGNFEQLKVVGNFHVNYTQDGATKLTLSADENLHELIETEVRNNELNIRQKARISSKDRFKIELSSPSLTNVEASASARFISRNKVVSDRLSLLANAGAHMEIEGDFQTLDADQNAGAKIILRGTARNLNIETNAGGSVDATEMEANQVTVSANAGASARVNAKELNASANAGGSVWYIGEPVMKNISTSAGGNIRQQSR
jgi:hypothetical protein